MKESRTIRAALRRFSLLMVCSLVLSFSACNTVAPPSQTSAPVAETTLPGTSAAPETTQIPDTTEPETTEAISTETPETTSPPETTEPETTAPESTEPVTTEPETTAPPETTEALTSRKRTASMLSDDDPAFINPLTGLPAEEDLSGQRPAAIMINNLKISCPQNGVSKADIIYECLAEGGVTRLMLLTHDYASLPVVGSVRSARDYFLDFAADYDALFIHAGGSEYAYDSIDEYDVDNLDGVNMYIPNMFYRDTYRMQTMGIEHSLMTDGAKIVAGIRFKKYRTELQEDFDYPLDFIRYGTVEAFEQPALSIHIPLSVYQVTDFKYSEENELYFRYQFNGSRHIDGTTGEQLAFENVMILFCETGAITGDAKNRIDVQTTGRGRGYYATLGTMIEIEWEKESYYSPIRFFYTDGTPLLVNRGKTFVTVCPTTTEKNITFN